jgi:CHASE3 domain sensor protein
MRCYATAVDEAALSAKGAANDARGFLISGNRTYVDEFNRRTTEAQAAFAAAVDSATGATESQVAEQARAVFEQWIGATRREFAAFAAGNRPEAILGFHRRGQADQEAL